MFPERELTFVLPYLGKISLDLKQSKDKYRERFIIL